MKVTRGSMDAAGRQLGVRSSLQNAFTRSLPIRPSAAAADVLASGMPEQIPAGGGKNKQLTKARVSEDLRPLQQVFLVHMDPPGQPLWWRRANQGQHELGD
jgi:hypothetical protein